MDKRPASLTPAALEQWIPQLQREKKMYKFYKTPEWLSLRDKVLEFNHYECEDCKRKSPAVITRATCVHHERTVEEYPGLSLETFYIDERGRRQQQLHALCDSCHNARHHRFDGPPSSENEIPPLTPERW